MACQRRLKIRPRGGAKDCHLGWWSDLGVRLGVGDAVRGFFGGGGPGTRESMAPVPTRNRPSQNLSGSAGLRMVTVT